MRTLAIVNQKGGSGKTTTAVNLAAVLARRGEPVLLVDLDPQGHCSLALSVPEASIDRQIGDALIAPDDRPVDPSRLVWQPATNLDLIPSTMKLAALEAARGGLADRPDREHRLSQALARFRDRYAWCLIDCPPHIGLLTFNALAAAGEVIIPVETGFFALRGAKKQVSTVQAIARRMGVRRPMHLLPTLLEHEDPVALDVMNELRRAFGSKLADVAIRRDHRLREAAALGTPVIELDPECPASHDYTALGAYLAENPPRVTHDDDDHGFPQHAPPADPGFEEDWQPRRLPSDSTSLVALREMIEVRRSSPGAANSRAAELAARARSISERAESNHTARARDPRVASVMESLTEPKPAQPSDGVTRLYGARPVSGGVLFVQPGPPDARIAIAGDHNGWSPEATVLRFDHATGVHQASVVVPPGTYRYRIIVNGVWMADPYNPHTEPNEYGDRNSVVESRSAPAPL
ncbi:MAG: AAA family ATPase [Planctomycetota bacterium]